ncbi:MAG: hypothetical protein U0521_21225 [Anaerolineae bacterium]
MTLKPDFNYDTFVGEYRAACAERGIDPTRGATGYQVVHVTAERRRTAYCDDGWWRRHDLWLNSPPYHSDTEQQALWNLFAQAYVLMAIRLAWAVRRRRERPLRDLHRRAAGER